MADGPPIDAAALEERAARVAGHPTGDPVALGLVVRCMDLTSLEGTEMPETIRELAATAIRPEAEGRIPSVAAVCVLPDLVPVAAEALRGTGVKVAGVAGDFPAGAAPLSRRLDEVRRVVESGADEVDVVFGAGVIDREDARQIFDEVVAYRSAAADATLKVILETGRIGSYDLVRKVSMLALAGGADFVKTSTGKVTPGATLPAALCMMEAATELTRRTGRRAGVKVAGGIRRVAEAERYVALARSTLGPTLTPGVFRVGASSLLADVIQHLR